MKRIENSQNFSSKEGTISNLKGQVVGQGGNGFTTGYVVGTGGHGLSRGQVVGQGENGLNREHVVGTGGHEFIEILF